MFKSWALFEECLTEINNAKLNIDKKVDVVTPMYNLLGYSSNYLKTSKSLYEHCREELALDNFGAVVDVNNDNASDPFKCKETINRPDTWQWHKKS